MASSNFDVTRKAGDGTKTRFQPYNGGFTEEQVVQTQGN